MLTRIKWQLALAIFWFVSAYLAVGALGPWEWAWRCGWLNLIIGMIGLILVTRTEAGAQMFYQGPQGEQKSSLAVALLWAMPVAGLTLAGIWWILRFLGLFSW